MKNIKLIAIFLLLINFLNAQTTFQKVYGVPASDTGHYVIQTTDGGYIIACTTTSIGEGGRDVYVVKTDAAGDIVWTKTFGGALDNEYGYCIQQTADGGYIVSGQGAFNGFSGEIDFYLIKLTATGDTSWTKTYGGNGNENALAVKGSKLFDPSGKGRAMKEWVQVPFDASKQWKTLALSALEYVNKTLK